MHMNRNDDVGMKEIRVIKVMKRYLGQDKDQKELRTIINNFNPNIKFIVDKVIWLLIFVVLLSISFPNMTTMYLLLQTVFLQPLFCKFL